MKMIIAIVRNADYDAVAHGLTSAGLRVTCIASTGGFWRKGNNTLLIGLEDEKVEQAIETIRQNCTAPLEANTRKATIFVLSVGKYIHF